MVRVEGSLTVLRRNGARGSFSVGDLVTNIGEFKVKDAILDQFEPGEYVGEFIIKWIQPATFTWRGRVSVENRATLADIIVHTADERDDVREPQPPERDPIDERPVLPQSELNAPSSDNTAAPAPIAAAVALAPDLAEEDLALFGAELHEQFQQRAEVKLDPTLDREWFRKQCNRLRKAGYRPDPKRQVWFIEQATKPQ